jgi:hypothetical protein
MRMTVRDVGQLCLASQRECDGDRLHEVNSTHTNAI